MKKLAALALIAALSGGALTLACRGEDERTQSLSGNRPPRGETRTGLPQAATSVEWFRVTETDSAGLLRHYGDRRETVVMVAGSETSSALAVLVRADSGEARSRVDLWLDGFNIGRAPTASSSESAGPIGAVGVYFGAFAGFSQPVLLVELRDESETGQLALFVIGPERRVKEVFASRMRSDAQSFEERSNLTLCWQAGALAAIATRSTSAQGLGPIQWWSARRDSLVRSEPPVGCP